MLLIRENNFCINENVLQISVIAVFCLSFILFRYISNKLEKKNTSTWQSNQEENNFNEISTNASMEFDENTIDFFMKD